MRALRFLVSLLLTFLGLTLVTFAIGRIIPVDPVLAIAGDRASPELYEKIREQLALDRPIIVQYGIYLDKMLHGDLGTSVVGAGPVLDDIKRVFPATIELATAGTLCGVVLGVPLGIVGAIRRGRRIDNALRIFCLTGYSVPVFWLGLVGLYVLYLQLGWVGGPGRLSVAYDGRVPPVTGMILLDSLLAGEFHVLADALTHLALPAGILGFVSMAYIARMTRSFMLDQLGQEYVVTARVKGLSEWRVVMGHVFPNILVLLITVVVLSYANLLEGTVLVETVFSWPGIGQYITNSLFNADMNAVLGGTIVVGAVFLTLNTFADFLYRLADPRTR